MSAAVIIEARPDDYPAIADIYNEAIRRGDASMEERLKAPSDIAGWVRAFDSRERLYAQLQGDDVVGWGIIKRYSDREGYRFACETAVYLRQAQTRKGYGSAMKRHLIAQARAYGYRHMVAKVFATNEASIHYNLQLGYSIVGTQNEVGYKHGRWLDIVIMQLILK